jgi:hypothetical protein
MKKLVITSACVLGFAGAALAQGTINWQSLAPTGLTFQTNTTVSSFLSVGGSQTLASGTIGATASGTTGLYYYELLYNTAATEQAAPTTLAALDSWSDAGLEAENNSGSAGKTSTINPSQGSVVPFTTASSLMVVGWSANLGTSWSVVSTVLNSPSALASVVGPAFFGESSVGFLAPAPSGTIPGTTIIGIGPNEIDSVNTQLEPIATPEPTTIALGVMGAASLLALRRKKA